MDSNFEWQRFRAQEREAARRQEAAAHRLAQEGGNGRKPILPACLAVFRAVWSGGKRLFVWIRGRFAPIDDPVEKREGFV